MPVKQKQINSYNRQHMENMDNIMVQMMEMLEVISFNAGYIRYFESPAVLNQPELYFDICKIIFPELNIKIVKIQQYKVLSPAENMQQLIDLLASELKVNLVSIKGQQILRYNLPHIYNFLSVLYEYSKIFLESNLIKFDVRSESAHIKRKEQNKIQPMSAREPQRQADKVNAIQQENNRNQANYSENNEEGDQIIPKNNNNKKTGLSVANRQIHKPTVGRHPKTKGRAQYSVERKKARSMRDVRNNIHSTLVNTIMQEKTRMLRASTRDNRKNKMSDVEQAKREYKVYLQRYVKDNHAKTKRDQFLKSKGVSIQQNKKPTLNDFKKIDKFFESFQYKLLDKKAIYLKKMQQLVRRQELDRCCHINRIERETKKYMEDKLKSQIQAERHQYRVKSELQQEQSRALQKGVAQMMREERVLASQQRRQLKEAKKRDMEHIENILKEDNQRVLMSLEEGGRLEQIIMKMYKRF